ncbi:MAG TPA: hypothetical protein VM553_13830 [Dongiaceae bacterium]|nr:hypothetical protein [Dongiaceae bacterium]
MMRTNLVAALLLPSLLLTGCGGAGETPRSTSNSANLTGLWRLQLTTSQSGMTAESHSSFHVTESGGVLNMVACDNREQIKLQKTASGIEGLPIGTAKVVNNDTLTAQNDLGKSKATKMATTAKFDMGTLQLSSPQLGTQNFSDLCVQSSDARVLGVATQDNFIATTLFNGKPLLFDILTIGNLTVGTYKLSSAPAVGEATLRLQGDGLKTPLNRTELSFDKGTLTITQDSPVWLKGSFSATMPNGSALTGNFSLEKP